MDICSIILSAGKGNRMSSDIPKPLHTISGKPMLEWVIDANKAAKIEKSIIVIPENNEFIKSITSDIKTVIQPISLGTGDAVKMATQQLIGFSGIILICFADTPFIAPKSLLKIIKAFDNDTKLVVSGFKKTEKIIMVKLFFHKKIVLLK